MNKICFINPPYHVFIERLTPPFNLMYLAAIAERAGWKAEIIDMNQNDDTLPDADVFGVTSSSPQWPETIKVSERLDEEFPDSLIIIGGNHISSIPNDIKNTKFDVAVLGEGEMVLEKILKDRENGKDNYNQTTLLAQKLGVIKDLDSIPFPSRHLIDYSKYKRGIYWGGELLAPAVSIISSRGCPFNCIFCGSRVVFGRGTRFRSVDNVVAEIKDVIDNIGYRGFNFHDDTFCLNSQRVIGMSKEFTKLDIVWRCLSRVETMNEKMLAAMEESGCKEIILGVESGSQKILNNLNKHTTVEQNLKAMKMVKKSGIQLKVGIIVGSPGETWETVEETKKLLKACPPDFWNVSVFTPFPGTCVWDQPEKYGLKILTRDLHQFAMVGKDYKGIVVVETEDMKKEDIEHGRDDLIDLLKDISPPHF
jgi:anaerobic magnesium-protoporphyrin IX monomethyl ester cyclase